MHMSRTSTSREAAAQLTSAGFHQTDDQSLNHQYVKQLGPHEFEVAQEDASTGSFEMHRINLLDYALEDIRRMTSGYYDSLIDLHKLNGESTCQVIAEIIAEELTANPESH